MKAIIDRKIYSTETATIVGEYSNGLGGGDFAHVRETLYRTPKGKYFLYGEGGPMSQWSRQHDDNSSSGGKGIRPLSDKAAYEWAERCLEPYEILEEFSSMVEPA